MNSLWCCRIFLLKVKIRSMGIPSLQIWTTAFEHGFPVLATPVAANQTPTNWLKQFKRKGQYHVFRKMKAIVKIISCWQILTSLTRLHTKSQKESYHSKRRWVFLANQKIWTFLEVSSRKSTMLTSIATGLDHCRHCLILNSQLRWDQENWDLAWFPRTAFKTIYSFHLLYLGMDLLFIRGLKKLQSKISVKIPYWIARKQQLWRLSLLLTHFMVPFWCAPTKTNHAVKTLILHHRYIVDMFDMK